MPRPFLKYITILIRSGNCGYLSEPARLLLANRPSTNRERANTARRRSRSMRIRKVVEGLGWTGLDS